jgi:hypothetical protein
LVDHRCRGEEEELVIEKKFLRERHRERERERERESLSDIAAEEKKNL